MTTLANTSAGTTIYISAAAPATYDQTGYEALSWTEIGEVVDLPEFGKAYTLVTHNPLGDRKTYKRKGSYNEGSMGLSMARAPEDAGQAIAIAGLDSDDPYQIRVDHNDGLVTNTNQYMPGLIMSYTTITGGVDSIRMATMNVEIDGDIVEVAKTDA